jgi:hypothetical protein
LEKKFWMKKSLSMMSSRRLRGTPEGHRIGSGICARARARGSAAGRKNGHEKKKPQKLLSTFGVQFITRW